MDDDKWVDVDLGVEIDDVEPELEVDDVGSVVPIKTYTVRRTYRDGATRVEAGTDIAVTCGNCALWERSTAADDPSGKPMCRHGRKIAAEVDGEIDERRMNAHQHSCQQKFLPKDLENVATQLPQDYGEALALKWFVPTIRQVLKVRQRIYKWYSKHCPDGDPERAVGRALLCLTDFTSPEQLEHVLPLINDFTTILKAKQAKRKAKRERFFRGDVVAWTDPATNARIEGFVLTVGGRLGEINIMVDQKFAHHLKSEVDYAIPVSFPLSEWKEKYDPEIIRKAEAPIKPNA